MTTIVTKNGSGAPLASDLVQGELAVDLTNKRLYTEDSGGSVIELGSNPTSLTTGTFTSTGIDDNATSTAITIDSSENVLVGDTSQSGTANKVMVKSANKFGLSIIDTTAQATGVGGALNLGGNYRTSGDAQAFTRVAALKDNSTDSNFAYSMGFYTTPNGGTFTERMRIDSSGNVGINTTSPTAKLHIVEASSTPAVKIKSGTNTNQNTHITMFNDNDGGTLSLGVFGSSATTFGTITAADGFISSNQELCLNSQNASGAIKFGVGTSVTERMRIDSSGNVGIGTSSNIAGINLEIKKAGAYLGLNSTTAGYSLVRGYDNGTERWSIGQIGFGGADGMAFYTGSSNTERMRIDSSGNVGIGTSSPIARLNVEDTSGDDNGFYVFKNGRSSSKNYSSADMSASSICWIQAQENNTSLANTLVMRQYDAAVAISALYNTTNTGSLAFGTNNGSASVVERMRIDSSGNLLVGTTDGNFVNGVGLKIANATAARLKLCDSTHGVGASNGFEFTAAGLDGYIYNNENGATIFGTNASERMRIDSSGNLLVGTTSTSAVIGGTVDGQYLGSSGTRYSSDNGTGGKNHNIFYNANGQVGSISTSGSSTTFSTSSDQRLKENIVDAPAGNIDAIQVRSFDWKADGSHQTYGMVAQELVEVAPEAVSQGETEEDMWGVDYSKLVPMMIKEIQDLKAEVAALKGA